jgi:hypothetical protein
MVESGILPAGSESYTGGLEGVYAEAPKIPEVS